MQIKAWGKPDSIASSTTEAVIPLVSGGFVVATTNDDVAFGADPVTKI